MAVVPDPAPLEAGKGSIAGLFNRIDLRLANVASACIELLSMEYMTFQVLHPSYFVCFLLNLLSFRFRNILPSSAHYGT